MRYRVKRNAVQSRVKCRGCETRFTAVQQHVPGDHARLLVSHSRRRSSLSTFCDVRLRSANCGGRAEGVKRRRAQGELREGGKREAVPILRLQVVDFRHSRRGHLAKLARRFSIERPTKRDKPTGINRYCVLQLNKAIRLSNALSGRLPAVVGPSDRNNDRCSSWPVCVVIQQYSRSLRSIGIQVTPSFRIMIPLSVVSRPSFNVPFYALRATSFYVYIGETIFSLNVLNSRRRTVSFIRHFA